MEGCRAFDSVAAEAEVLTVDYVFVGVDPGQYGGLAVIDSERHVLLSADMPTLADARQVDAVAISGLLQGAIDSDAYCMLEQAQAMPKQGVTSVFNYGVGYGKILAVLEWCRIPFELVRPAKWKKSFSLGRDKKDSVVLAQRLFPEVEFCTPRGRMRDGMAEALLLAEYARRTFLNGDGQ